MPSTIATVRDEILAAFKDAWEENTSSSSVLVLYENVPGEPPDQADPITGKIPPYVRVSVRHLTGEQATLAGALGTRTFRRDGIVTVQVFTPTGDGFTEADILAPIAKNAFEGASTASGVWFRNVRYNEIGTFGAWFQINVIADFIYDEIR